MTSNVIHTIAPGAAIPEGFFDYDNICFMQQKISELLHREFYQTIVVQHNDIIRVMQWVLSERRENIPKMNQRVIMTITNDFRNHQIDVNKHLKWEEGYSD